MPPRFIQTFNALYNKLPFADTARTVLRAWAEAVRRELGVDAAGYAIHFDGVDDFVNVPHDAAWGANTGLNIINEISVEAWVYWENVGADVDVICSKGVDVYQLETGAGGVVNCLRFTPLAGVTITSPINTFPSNQWNHVVATFNSATRAGFIYVNGVDTAAVVVDGGGPLAASAAAWNWGQETGGATPFEGRLDECRVWGKVLSAAEVTELYAAGAGFYLDAEALATAEAYAYQLRGYWRFDEGTGLVTDDASPTGADGTLTNGPTWVAGKVPTPKCLQTAANRVYDAIFLPRARTAELDAWGALLNVARTAGESDPAYRTRLLTAWQASAYALTIKALTDALNLKGATYVPVLSVTRIDEYYKDRNEDGVDPADTWSLGDRWGLCELDLLSFGVVLSRIPTAVEAQELINIVAALKAAQVCGWLLNQLATLPITYRARAKAYSATVAAWLWDDNFNRATLPGAVTDLYNTYGDAAPVWTYTALAALWGDASNGAGGGVPRVCVPKLTLASPLLLRERDIYVDAQLKIDVLGAGTGFAGVALRYDEATNKGYFVGFATTPASTYTVYYFDGAAWNVLLGPTAVGVDMAAAYRRVQVTLEDKYLTLIVAGTVLESRTDIGVAIATAQRWGFCCKGINVDLYADDIRYW